MLRWPGSGSAERSYCFSVGDAINDNYTWTNPSTGSPLKLRGPFGSRVCIRMRDFNQGDGSSNTIAMGERDLGNPGNLNDVIGHIASTGSATDPAGCLATQVNGHYTSCSLADHPGQFWAIGEPYYNSVAIILPPNSPSCGAPAAMSIISVNSRHPGGAHVLFADGG